MVVHNQFEQPVLPFLSVIEAIELAASLLKHAGFVLAFPSLKSEACYYTYPGRIGLIRIAAHKHNKTHRNYSWGQKKLITKITFRTSKGNRDGITPFNANSLFTHIQVPIGKFFLLSEPEERDNT